MLLHELCLLLHGYLLLQDVLHVLNDSIVSNLSSCHDFGHHFVVYHHLVHLVVEHLHLVGHRLEVEVPHRLTGHVCQAGEIVDQLFVVLHRLHLTAHVVHLQGDSLGRKDWIERKLHSLCLAAALMRYILADSSSFFFRESFAFFLYF
jgi:hypothetical protein